MTSLRVAAATIALAPVANPRAWVDRVAARVRVATDAGARLVVLPEYVTAPLLSLDPDLAAWTGLWHHTMQELARAHDITLLGGTHLMQDGERRVNRALLIEGDGRITVQDKLHPTPWERRWRMTPNDVLTLARVEGVTVAVTICYDVEFPELVRRAAKAGAEVLLVPSWTDDAAGFHRVRTCAAARCIENACYAVHAPLVGGMDVLDFEQACGSAGILTPSDIGFPVGGVAVAGAWNEPTTVVADLDLDRLRLIRAAGTVSPFADARPAESYRVG